VQLYNVSPDWRRCHVAALGALGGVDVVDRLGGEAPELEGDHVVLPPYAALWLTRADS